ncbi:MAG: M48 family metalloprotease [Alphaproteobacteria bacterium]|nr:M48 family metalloprotease [Alphaproteobacteria bacterium]
MRFFRIFILFCLPLLFSVKGQAIQGIRDVEIETFLEEIATPLFKSAGLAPSNIGIHLIADATPNAFIAQGQNLFVHVGLFILADNENEIEGVVAHETGHMKGGHLSRLADRMKNAQIQAIAGAVLGMGAMLGGGGEVGMAMMLGSADIAQKGLLAYSRNEERMADEIGLSLLEKNGRSAQGFLSFMEKLKKRQGLLMSTHISPYNLTHPLSTERESYIQQRMEEDSNLQKKNTAPSEQFQWIKAKVIGYFQSEDIAVDFKKDSDFWHYAKTFAFMRQNKFKSAQEHIKILIKKFPQNGYFYETQAQILFGLGEYQKAVNAYEKSLDILGDKNLIELEYCATVLEMKTSNLEDVETRLNVILLKNPKSSMAYKLLATLYEKQNKVSMKDYAFAEYYALLGDKARAKQYLSQAEQKIAKDSLTGLKISDLKKSLEKKDD